jgi:uncharacterized membrane protein
MTRSASRRRPTPWLHRWSRPLIAGVAALGALLTGYLTVSHMAGSKVACPTSGCDIVLTSDYASLFNIPLSLFGCLAYLGMFVLAVGPLFLKSGEAKDQRKRLEDTSWLLLFAGAVGMVIFSGYLMYVLSTEIKVACLYCIASACFTVLLLGLTLLGREWKDVGNLLFIGLIVGMITLIGSLGLYVSANKDTTPEPPVAGQTGQPSPQALTLGPTGQAVDGVGWAVTTSSGEAELQLAQHLSDIGAKAYMGWTCPHCYEQKQLFGKEAAAKLPRVECVASGRNAQLEQCAAAKVEAFPTWVINGQSYQGVKTLNRLADLSQYRGPRNFKNFAEIRFPE